MTTKIKIALLAVLLALPAICLPQTKVKTGGIADGAITTAKLAGDSVTAGKIVDGAVGAAEIDADAVTASEIAADAVGTSEIDDGTVAADDLAATLDLSGKALTLPEGLNGWTYAAQTATTSGTTVVLSVAIPSTAVEVEIIFSGVSTSAVNQPPLVQLGDAGGYETASYVASSGVIEAAAAGETDITTGFQAARAAEWAATDALSGVVTLSRWDAAEHLWLARGTMTASGAEMHFVAGAKTTSEGLTSVRLNTPGGAATFDAGEARVRYR